MSMTQREQEIRTLIRELRQMQAVQPGDLLTRAAGTLEFVYDEMIRRGKLLDEAHRHTIVLQRDNTRTRQQLAACKQALHEPPPPPVVKNMVKSKHTKDPVAAFLVAMALAGGLLAAVLTYLLRMAP